MVAAQNRPLLYASAAYLKFLLTSREFDQELQLESGTRIDGFASAHDFPKFVRVAAEAVHELRKVGTSLNIPA